MGKPITPAAAAHVAAELRRLHPVQYASLPSGEDASVDAYNLLVASLGGQDMMARAIIDRQLPHGELGPLLGAVVAILVTVFRQGIAHASHPLYLERLSVIAQAAADTRLAAITPQH